MLVLMLKVTRVVKESQEWEGDLVFTLRNQKVRQPDRVVQVSLRYVLTVELLKMKNE